MIKSNAKSLLDNTVMLYKQRASPRHDWCLDQRSFKCKIGENCSNILCIWGQNSNRQGMICVWIKGHLSAKSVKLLQCFMYMGAKFKF